MSFIKVILPIAVNFQLKANPGTFYRTMALVLSCFSTCIEQVGWDGAIEPW